MPRTRISRFAIALTAAATLAALSSTASARPPFIALDNGFGTVDMPPNPGQYITPDDDMMIINGLPPGTTIQIDSVLHSFFYNPGNPGSVYTGPGAHVPGGSLGGDIDRADGTLDMPMVGTGLLAGFNPFKSVPVSFEIHDAPRTPFDPIQSFDTDIFRFFGQITGDPDFDLLRITGGTDFGMPSPGHTTLTSLGGGQWNVDSFFDITYRIDFVGHPGSPLGGMSGSTTGTIRIQLGEPIPTPAGASLLAIGGLIALRRRR